MRAGRIQQVRCAYRNRNNPRNRNNNRGFRLASTSSHARAVGPRRKCRRFTDCRPRQRRGSGFSPGRLDQQPAKEARPLRLLVAPVVTIGAGANLHAIRTPSGNYARPQAHRVDPRRQCGRRRRPDDHRGRAAHRVPSRDDLLAYAAAVESAYDRWADQRRAGRSTSSPCAGEGQDLFIDVAATLPMRLAAVRAQADGDAPAVELLTAVRGRRARSSWASRAAARPRRWSGWPG